MLDSAPVHDPLKARLRLNIIPRDQHCISRKNISDNALKVLARLRNGGYQAYLVGGAVRDLILGAGQEFDIDIVVEGDGIKFARRVQKLLPGKLVPHKRFGTATIFSHEHGRLDFATAREEDGFPVVGLDFARAGHSTSPVCVVSWRS